MSRRLLALLLVSVLAVAVGAGAQPAAKKGAVITMDKCG